MRSWLTSIFLGALLVPPVFAAPLEENQLEASFQTRYAYDKKFNEFSGGLGIFAIVSDGLIEPGIEIRYATLRFKGDADDSLYGYAISPSIHYNFTPQNPMTAYVSLAYTAFAGELADYFAAGYAAGLGLKATFKERFSGFALLEYQKRTTERPGDFTESWPTRNMVQFSLGVSFYTWKK